MGIGINRRDAASLLVAAPLVSIASIGTQLTEALAGLR